MSEWRPKYLIAHDTVGQPNVRTWGRSDRNPYHAVVGQSGDVGYRYGSSDPYGTRAPHAAGMNPYAVGIALADDIGATPSYAAMETLKRQVAAVDAKFGQLPIVGHGEMFERTKNTPLRASKFGRSINEASGWSPYAREASPLPASGLPPLNVMVRPDGAYSTEMYPSYLKSEAYVPIGTEAPAMVASAPEPKLQRQGMITSRPPAAVSPLSERSIVAGHPGRPQWVSDALSGSRYDDGTPGGTLDPTPRLVAGPTPVSRPTIMASAPTEPIVSKPPVQPTESPTQMQRQIASASPRKWGPPPMALGGPRQTMTAAMPPVPTPSYPQWNTDNGDFQIKWPTVRGAG